MLVSNVQSRRSLGQEIEMRSITRIGDNSNIKDEEKVISRQSKKKKALKMVAYLIASFIKEAFYFLAGELQSNMSSPSSSRHLPESKAGQSVENCPCGRADNKMRFCTQAAAVRV